MSIVEIIYTPKKKSVPNTAHLVLKYKWYDMIASGEKTEEYRAINTWQRRFGKNIKYVMFHRGYSSVCALYEIGSVTVGRGKPEWGAPVDKDVLVIKLGKKIM